MHAEETRDFFVPRLRVFGQIGMGLATLWLGYTLQQYTGYWALPLLLFFACAHFVMAYCHARCPIISLTSEALIVRDISASWQARILPLSDIICLEDFRARGARILCTTPWYSLAETQWYSLPTNMLSKVDGETCLCLLNAKMAGDH